MQTFIVIQHHFEKKVGGCIRSKILVHKIQAKFPLFLSICMVPFSVKIPANRRRLCIMFQQVLNNGMMTAL